MKVRIFPQEPRRKPLKSDPSPPPGRPGSQGEPRGRGQWAAPPRAAPPVLTALPGGGAGMCVRVGSAPASAFLSPCLSPLFPAPLRRRAWAGARPARSGRVGERGCGAAGPGPREGPGGRASALGQGREVPVAWSPPPGPAGGCLCSRPKWPSR